MQVQPATTLSKILYPILGLVAVVLVAGTAFLVFSDVQDTALREPPERPAAALARVALAELTPEQGWFPHPQEPLFSWDADAESWRLEQEQSLALDENGIVRVAPSAETPDPEVPPTEPAPAEQEPPTGEDEGETARDPALDGMPLEVDAGVVSHPQSRASLSVPVHFPDACTIFRRPTGMSGVRFIAYDVFVPAEVRGYVGCLFFLKDKDGRWFQARSKAALQPGEWTTVTADLRGGSPDVAPLGHLGAWEENQASQVRTIGITFYGDRPFAGKLHLDRFRGWLRQERFEKVLAQEQRHAESDADRERLAELNLLWERAPARDPDEQALEILNLRTDPLAAPAEAGGSGLPRVGLFQTCAVRFELNRQVYNPFDPEQADIRATVTAPSGRTLQVFGFWHQDFEDEPYFAEERLAPVGRPEWHVRVTPRELGEHTIAVQATLYPGTEKEVSVAAPPVRFTAVPSGHKGFVRVARKDPRCFEFEDGSFFYPVGHNVHSPVDLRCWDVIFEKDPPLFRGLNMYKDFFPKMSAAGESVGEVWMASWWLAIEWTRRWRHFHGPGRYSLEHAWKLDRVLALAREHGMRIHLVIDNHGKFSQWCDWEWDLNPLNRLTEPGGVVATPSQFLTQAAAKNLHKKRLRYIAARWGADPTIMGWELVSEYDLIGDGSKGKPSHPKGRNYFRTPEGQDWAREMLGALREYDTYGHLVTNHYATDYTYVDKELALSPAMDYIVGDAYRAQPGYHAIAQAWANAFREAKKPYWITEFGGNWNATSIPRLEADLHCGLWSTWMTEAGGAPLFWWYDFIDKRELYPTFRAFANYIAGEDRRGLEAVTEQVRFTRRSGGLGGLQYRWKDGAYVWIYDVNAMNELPELPHRAKFENVGAQVQGLAPGKYRLECWDTRSGAVVKTLTVDLQPGQALDLDLPEFVTDIALKVKPASGGDIIKITFPDLGAAEESPAPIKPPSMPEGPGR
ncbi:MAG: hypothetical protein AMXMBFR7_10420 [Planctomycetota bacterium]